MDQDDDVERLFSWIKTPDLHYREFAAGRDVADAVATWPTPRQAAPEPAPHSEAEIDQAEAETRPPERRPSGRSPLGERLISIFGHREPAPPAHQQPAFDPLPDNPPHEEHAGDVPWAPAEPSPIFAHLQPAPTRRLPEPPPPPPATAQEPAFDATYRGFEQEGDEAPEPAQPPSQDANGRSLDAIFSRVAHTPGNGRDERKQTSGGSGLGPIFRRLR
ncbi:MAG TPA: hypothetical protein VHW66_03660 [Stellaceae bacterium]|jgi:hypothetical protein|nr:hypothetical protein [Stellaceae bacterium]